MLGSIPNESDEGHGEPLSVITDAYSTFGMDSSYGYVGLLPKLSSTSSGIGFIARKLSKPACPNNRSSF